MNYANQEQLYAVGQACPHFNPEKTITNQSTGANEISCLICKNWDGEKCVIDVFDDVLLSLDQT